MPTATAQSTPVLRVREMEVRYLPGRHPLPVEGRIQSPLEAARLASDATANATIEEVLSLHLDARHNLIGLHRVSQGTLDSAPVHPREVFKVSLLANAASVILAHNHPSGDPTPSDEDVVVAADLQDPTGAFPKITGITETAERLYVQNINTLGLGWRAP